MTKVAVVVGVGAGLGSAIAHRFAREGFTVALMARNAEQLTHTQKEIESYGGKALAVRNNTRQIRTHLTFTRSDRRNLLATLSTE